MANATITADLVLYTAAWQGELFVECELEAQPGDPIANLKEPLAELIIRQAAENGDEAYEMVSEELTALRATAKKLEDWLAANPQ